MQSFRLHGRIFIQNNEYQTAMQSHGGFLVRNTRSIFKQFSLLR